MWKIIIFDFFLWIFFLLLKIERVPLTFAQVALLMLHFYFDTYKMSPIRKLNCCCFFFVFQSSQCRWKTNEGKLSDFMPLILFSALYENLMHPQAPKRPTSSSIFISMIKFKFNAFFHCKSLFIVYAL